MKKNCQICQGFMNKRGFDLRANSKKQSFKDKQLKKKRFRGGKADSLRIFRVQFLKIKTNFQSEIM